METRQVPGLTPRIKRVKGGREKENAMRGLLMAYLSSGLFGFEAHASAGSAGARARFTKTTAKTTTAKTV